MAVRKSPRWSPQEATGMRRRGNGRKRTSTWRVVSTNVRGKFSGASHSSQLQGRKVSSIRALRNLFTMERRALQS